MSGDAPNSADNYHVPPRAYGKRAFHASPRVFLNGALNSEENNLSPQRDITAGSPGAVPCLSFNMAVEEYKLMSAESSFGSSCTSSRWLNYDRVRREAPSLDQNLAHIPIRFMRSQHTLSRF